MVWELRTSYVHTSRLYVGLIFLILRSSIVFGTSRSCCGDRVCWVFLEGSWGQWECRVLNRCSAACPPTLSWGYPGSLSLSPRSFASQPPIRSQPVQLCDMYSVPTSCTREAVISNTSSELRYLFSVCRTNMGSRRSRLVRALVEFSVRHKVCLSQGDCLRFECRSFLFTVDRVLEMWMGVHRGARVFDSAF